MKTGIGSYAFRYAIGHPEIPAEKRMTLKSLLEFCQREGVEALQICENINLVEIPESELYELAVFAKEKNIEIELGTAGYNPERISFYLKYCRSFDARILRTVLNASRQKSDLKGIVKDLQKEIPLLEAANVTLAIENHFDLDPMQLAWVIKEINHPLVRVCIDPLNSMTLLWGVNETLEQLLPFVVSTHIKDVVLERQGAGFYIKGCPIGEGLANAENYLKTIYESNPSCNMFIEQWMDQEKTTEATLETELYWVKHGLSYIRKLLKTKELQSF
jgi:3-oxoisoapionate decarboxylase